MQNLMLLLASYVFYASWDWRFLFLLLFSTGLDYYTGIKMYQSGTNRIKSFWFWVSVIINIGFLGVFKYYNFFISSFSDAISVFGFKPDFWTLQIILPVGISFYTFHGLSYVVDIYKNRITPEKNIVDYALFVSYFPLLVAGPIERATHLLPQIKKKRIFNESQAVQGLKQIVWGFFKKIVIADNCAFFVNQIFENTNGYSSVELWIGSILFAFQIYGDFSGYSDIALGTSKLFGIELLRNFNFPYFSKDIADFWRKWHISLSTWFRDYLYIPLGGSKVNKKTSVRNTFIIFLVSGFWHGANWTFIVWGGIHALLFMPLLLTNNNRKNLDCAKYTIHDIPKVIVTFLLICISWVFFRANHLNDAIVFITGMFNYHNTGMHFFIKNPKYILLTFMTVFSILILVLIEWNNVKKNNYEIRLHKWTVFFLLGMIFFMGSFKNQLSFIYFQF